MHNRERALDVGLLQSGKFREALEGLLQWLADTEDLVAHQKPPSADYKVVKAQVQEQRFLRKLLLDRQGSVSSLSDMGREMAKKCSPAERAEIEGQLQELIQRFDALNDQAAERMKQLEDAMKVGHRYALLRLYRIVSYRIVSYRIVSYRIVFILFFVPN